MWETEGDDSVSKGNEGEAQIVKVAVACCIIILLILFTQKMFLLNSLFDSHIRQIQVQKLLDAGLKPEELGVITPYNLQVGCRFDFFVNLLYLWFEQNVPVVNCGPE